MSDVEEWRPIVGFPKYEVSSLGRVLSHVRGKPRVLRPSAGTTGYLTVCLTRGGERKYRLVHRLVAEAFTGPGLAGYEVRHLDGDKTNNSASNLAWGTSSENSLDQLQHGTHPFARRDHCLNGHPYDAANTSVDVTKPTARRCLACHRANEARRRAARRVRDEDVAS